MSTGICLDGVDCVARATFEKHLVRIICCPCRGAPNAVFSPLLLWIYLKVWRRWPHRGEDIAVVEENDNSFLISSARSGTELDGDAELPQVHLFQCRQWLIEERLYKWLVLLQFLLSHSKASYRVWQCSFAAGSFISAFLELRKISKCMWFPSYSSLNSSRWWKEKITHKPREHPVVHCIPLRPS